MKTTTKLQQVTITRRQGSSHFIEYEVSVDGKPFGMVWKNKNTLTCKDTWKCSYADERTGSTGHRTYKEAETAMRASM